MRYAIQTTPRKGARIFRTEGRPTHVGTLFDARMTNKDVFFRDVKEELDRLVQGARRPDLADGDQIRVSFEDEERVLNVEDDHVRFVSL